MEKLTLDMRDQVAKSRQEQETVQRFLKQQLAGEVEMKNVTVARQQEINARDAELAARKQAAKMEEERMQQRD